MDKGSLAILIEVLAVFAGFAAWFMWRMKRVDEAKSWPSTEAAIQSAGMEEISSGRSTFERPVFAFTYLVDGEYYSGRFALLAKGDRADELIRDMVDKKLTVNYNPQRPDSWYIPDKLIEQCVVEQKLNVIGIHPED